MPFASNLKIQRPAPRIDLMRDVSRRAFRRISLEQARCRITYCDDRFVVTMAIAHVQGNAGFFFGGNMTTFAVVLPSTVTSGSLVCGSLSFENSLGQTLVSVTDDKSNTYNIVDTRDDTPDTQVCASFYLANVTNSPKTITATFSGVGSSANGMLVDEYSGVATSSPLDVHTSNIQTLVGTGANAITSTAVTTTVPGDLIYGATWNTLAVATPAAGTGFTLQQSQTSFPSASEFRFKALRGR